jgi:protein-S-isoprenylcysteine O-methyltransferase Ste14
MGVRHGLVLAWVGGMSPPTHLEVWLQLVWLAVLGLVVACVAWTVTHEEIFREPREYCVRRSREDPRPVVRKGFYVFTCEYCFSHWVALIFVALTRYHLLLDDWRGYLLSLFAVVGMANLYMSAFGRLRQEVKSEGLEAKHKEQVVELTRRQHEGEIDLPGAK